MATIARSRLADLWDRVRESYWFVPSLMATGALALALGLVRVDEAMADAGQGERPWLALFGARGLHADTALSILTALAGGMITVTGVVFSVTIVALQLASTQFGPRLLRTFLTDLGNQFVLGSFVATFVYALVVMASVRGGAQEFVPQLAVLVAVAIGVAAVGVLIYFIDHISHAIRIETGVEAISRELHAAIDELFPEGFGEEPPPGRDAVADLPADFDADARPVTAGQEGYIRHVDERALMEIACRRDLVLRLEYRPGEFVLDDSAVVSAWPADRATDEVAGELARCFAVGPQRTTLQDADFALRQLVEIAVRSLSPAINDPFTAVICIDRIGQGLARLARRRMPSTHRYDRAGRLWLVAKPVTLAGETARAVDPIMRAGGDNAEVVAALLDALGHVARRAREEADRRMVAELAQEVATEAEGRLTRERDRRFLADRRPDSTGCVPGIRRPPIPSSPPRHRRLVRPS